MVLNVDRELKFQLLQQMLNSDGWEVLHEHLTKLRDSDMISLSAAKRDLPDDYVRGRIGTLTWLLEGLSAEVQEYFREQHPVKPLGQPVEVDAGNPYAPEGQPFMEGEDFDK